MLWKLSRSPFACFVLNMCDADSSQSWVITLSMSICQSQLINSCQPHLQLSSSIVSTESWKSDKVPWYHIWYQTWIIMDPWFVIMFSICFSMCFSINWPYLGGVLPHFPSGGAMFSCRACVPRDKDADTVKVSVADIEAREAGRCLRTHKMRFGWVMPAVWHFFWKILFGRPVWKPVWKPVWSPFDKEDVLILKCYLIFGWQRYG